MVSFEFVSPESAPEVCSLVVELLPGWTRDQTRSPREEAYAEAVVNDPHARIMSSF